MNLYVKPLNQIVKLMSRKLIIHFFTIHINANDCKSRMFIAQGG
jgi:hypothetical protein